MISRICIPEGAGDILKILQDAGHEAYVVGGCVRDSIMGRVPKDWDICTSALPEKVLDIFSYTKVIPTGLKHGTVTIMLEDGAYEVTTFRIDGDYSDGRHPDRVTFTRNLEEDLSRRDFTINAMAYNPEKGLVDPFNGLHDLGKHRIRCVGNPVDRFNEDALRMLRAMRFAAVFRFNIEETTAEAIHTMHENLGRISAERIHAEMDKLLLGPKSSEILIEFSDVVATFIPEMKACIGFDQHNRYHLYDVYTHIIKALGNDRSDDLTLKWALLLHDIGKPLVFTMDENGNGHFYDHAIVGADKASWVLTSLKFDNKSKGEIVELIYHHNTTIAPTKKSIQKMLNKMTSVDQFRRFLKLQIADAQAHSDINQESRVNNIKACQQMLEDILSEDHAFSIKHLQINGRTILSMGLHQGPAVGQVLQYLLEGVIDGRFKNQYDNLCFEAMTYIKKNHLK